MMSYITCNHDDTSSGGAAREAPRAVMPFVSPEQETNAPRSPYQNNQISVNRLLAFAAKTNPQPAQF
jgi:hypothetical protein